MKIKLKTYRLSSMLLLMAVVAVLMVAIPRLYDWCTNPPSMSLSTVVVRFNQSESRRSRTKDVTEEEIIAAIESQLPTLVEGERVKQIFRRIVKDRRVPPSTTINVLAVAADSGSDHENWATNLTFKAGPESGYRPVSISIHEDHIRNYQ